MTEYPKLFHSEHKTLICEFVLSSFLSYSSCSFVCVKKLGWHFSSLHNHTNVQMRYFEFVVKPWSHDLLKGFQLFLEIHLTLSILRQEAFRGLFWHSNNLTTGSIHLRIVHYCILEKLYAQHGWSGLYRRLSWGLPEAILKVKTLTWVSRDRDQDGGVA